MENNIVEEYSNYFQKTKNDILHPTEWIIKALIGNHNVLPNQIHGKGKALDIGFGDGRNMILLSEIGYEVNGSEIDTRICNTVEEQFRKRYIKCCLKKGYNHQIDFTSNYFDLIIASSSLYYTNYDIDVNLNEGIRVLKPGKPFVFNIIANKSYLLKDAEFIDNDYAIIKKDPLGIRNGQKVFYCKNEKRLKSKLSLFFNHFYIGEYNVRHWDYVEHYYTIFAINDK
jgi:ubiquinone/menaquinone biosynthesis C-methylase UbiE